MGVTPLPALPHPLQTKPMSNSACVVVQKRFTTIIQTVLLQSGQYCTKKYITLGQHAAFRRHSVKQNPNSEKRFTLSKQGSLKEKSVPTAFQRHKCPSTRWLEFVMQFTVTVFHDSMKITLF